MSIKLVFILTLLLQEGSCSKDVERLFDVLFSKYEKLRRPVEGALDKVRIQLKLRLSRIIDVHEKDQTVTTSVWLQQEWTDYDLKWNPKDYGNVDVLFIPADLIWVPDIVLYNNADITEIRMQTRATVFFNGTIAWEIPAVYRSVCQINVEWFPFDEQHCSLKFGSWTYDWRALDLQHLDGNQTWTKMEVEDGLAENVSTVIQGIDLSGYYPSVEWDILAVPARRHNRYYQSCCPDSGSYVDITYYISIRRKPLFYTVNLVTPCVVICFLTLMVFYLPSESGKKITFSTYLLVSQTLFFLLLTDIIPSTSTALPLLCKYLLFTMLMVTLSVFLTVFTQNLHYRTPNTHRMPEWVRWMFVNKLPRWLSIRSIAVGQPHKLRVLRTAALAETLETLPMIQSNYCRIRHCENCFMPISHHDWRHFNGKVIRIGKRRSSDCDQGPEWLIAKACRNICFIATLIKKKELERQVMDEWKCVALVLNRIFLYSFAVGCLGGTLFFLLQAPSLQSWRAQPLQIVQRKSIAF